LTTGDHRLLRCPVCRAQVAGRERCRRCAADLRAWLGVLGWAWRWRDRARRRLLAGDASAALRAARFAVALQGTPRAQGLLLAAWAGLQLSESPDAGRLAR
jgi:hypothetical protein